MREVGDPVADELVAGLIRNGTRGEASALLKTLTRNDDSVPADLPETIRTYFNSNTALPEFADPVKIATAQRIYQLYNLEIGFMLMYAALPACYAAEKGAQVLMVTERMSKYGQIQTRLSETGQFVLDVMEPGGFAPDGRAFRSAQKVRLVHAMVRHHILAVDSAETIWNPDWGTPVNQEDMAGTMLAFSVHVLTALDRIGITLTPDEIEAFYHVWRVVGHLLGIAPEMLPVDYDDAMDLAHSIADRHFGPSEAGRHLTGVVLKMLEDSMPKQLQNYPHTMMRFCLGDEIADMIGVNQSDWTIRYVQARTGALGRLDQMRYGSSWLERLIGEQSRRLIGEVGFKLVEAMDQGPLLGEYAPFELPPQLRRVA